MGRKILVLRIVLALVMATGCGGKRRRETVLPPTSRPTTMVTPSAAKPLRPTNTLLPRAPTATPLPPLPTPTKTPLPHRAITTNDYVPEQRNFVDTVCVVVNFSGKPERAFDLRKYWDRIFGLDDPIRQLNAYYRENFYGQLELRPVTSPQMGDKGYIEVELPGVPQDYTFGWLIGMETEEMQAVDPEAAQKLVLEVMSRVVQKHPEINYQDKFILVVLNAVGSEYGRGAAGVIPTGGVDPVYDLFIGDIAQEDVVKFSDEKYFRIVDGRKVVGVIDAKGYTFDDYFRDREKHQEDQFILGMGLFGMDAPLSCASHDILHGLRRKSAYADPPEGRARAVNCLYNLVLQSQWVIGTEAHGHNDRSINCSPYIGWWDPMGDHLHPRMPRDFFSSYPHGMCAFTKLRMGFIPDRCLSIAEEDDVTIELAPLSNPYLPPPGSAAETMVIKVPLVPRNPTLAPVYLLLEYRRRVGSESGEAHPDNFSIDPDYVFGDKTSDPGYNSANPEASEYINPPTVFVPDEGMLVYLVNEKIPELPSLPYTEWYNFVLALLNPEGNDKRDNLNHAALDAGESMDIDFRTLIPGRGIPVKITVAVKARTNEYATVHITREYLR